ncbi:hypothetical protein REPUB_Repub11eG0045300 [Reevesia pubescens]
MAYTSMYNQSDHTCQWNFQQQMNKGMTHSQANQDQFLQGEASDQRRLGGTRRATMSEAQRERKRQIDRNYRQSKKTKVNEMTAKNEYLQEENGRLSAEIRHLKEEIAWLSTENKHFKDETGRLSLEYKHLEERIRGLQGKGQLPAEVPQRQDSFISQPTSQVDHQSAYVQEHYEKESNNEEAVYMDPHWIEFNNEGVVDGFDGLEINDLRSLLLPVNEMIPNGRVAIHEPAPEHPESCHSGLCSTEMAKTKFLMKLDAEVTSNIDFSDFTGLDEEQRSVGRYSFPLSLIPIVERINEVYGDVSATSLISPSVSGTIYVLFCATIRDMEHLQLEEVTEDKMLKWRDVIKDALRLNFDVRFAMEHLKKIACAYFGFSGCLLLKGIDAKILNLEAEVNDWKKKRAKIYEESKTCIDAAETFIGVPVSTGLFP